MKYFVYSRSYNITVVLASDGSNPPGVNFMQNVNMSRVEITGLMPGTEYNVSVATVDRFGEVPAGSPNTELTREHLFNFFNQLS